MDKIDKVKIIVAFCLLLPGFVSALLTYQLHDESEHAREYTSDGVDAAADGAAAGMGVFGGACVLASGLLLAGIERGKLDS